MRASSVEKAVSTASTLWETRSLAMTITSRRLIDLSLPSKQAWVAVREKWFRVRVPEYGL